MASTGSRSPSPSVSGSATIGAGWFLVGSAHAAASGILEERIGPEEGCHRVDEPVAVGVRIRDDRVAQVEQDLVAIVESVDDGVGEERIGYVLLAVGEPDA